MLVPLCPALTRQRHEQVHHSAIIALPLNNTPVNARLLVRHGGAKTSEAPPPRRSRQENRNCLEVLCNAKAARVSCMDWEEETIAAARRGGLLEHLAALSPPALWTQRDAYGNTLLHCACRGENAAAVPVLVAHGLDVDVRCSLGSTPAHNAAQHGQPRVLEALCVAGADLGALDRDGMTPLDWAIYVRSDACARVLVTRGVRLTSVRDEFRSCISHELLALEHGVLCCRAAAVVLARHHTALSRAIWATRCAREWQRLWVPPPVAPPPPPSPPPLEWQVLMHEAFEGRLLAAMHASVPPSRWQESDDGQGTLLHCACLHANNLDALILLIRHGLNLDQQCLHTCLWTPAHVAAFSKQPLFLELLCASGANMQVCSDAGETPLEVALPLSDVCVQVLLMAGMRLASVSSRLAPLIEPWMVALEQGRIQCRQAVVALLGLKRFRCVLVEIDRFVVREVTWAVWATRAHLQWQRHSACDSEEHPRSL